MSTYEGTKKRNTGSFTKHVRRASESKSYANDLKKSKRESNLIPPSSALSQTKLIPVSKDVLS